MEENNRKGPGIFYAVVGVATLVVAIIGATFAYFSASAADDDTKTITGQTASAASLKLTVKPVLPTATTLQGTEGRIIPLESGEENTEGEATSLMATALSKGCVADGGYVACQVYSIQVENAGTDPVLATPKVQLNDTGFTNLRWQLLTGTSATDFAVTGTSVKDHTNFTELNDVADLTSTTAAADATQYIVVWLEETGADQKETGLVFSGTVSLDVRDALGNEFQSQLTATFSS